MLLDLVYYGNPVLRKKTTLVTRFDDDLKILCQNMIQTMQEHNGIGIAATQVGSNLRIFIAEFPFSNNESRSEDPTPLIAINPKITPLSDEMEVEQEGCLSIPGLYAHVKRHSKVILEAFDVEGNPFQIQAEGLLARIFQHENDHLYGVLFIDKVLAGDKKSVEQYLKDFKQNHA